MRSLKFIVTGQKIERDPSCDFSGLAPGTSGYLKAEFSFSEEYRGCEKIAVFYRYSDEEYPVRIKNNSCMIPDEILKNEKFRVRAIGLRPGFKITTNETEVKQDG